MIHIWRDMNHVADYQALWASLGIVFEFFTADVEIYFGGKQEAELVWASGTHRVRRADFRIRFRDELLLTEEIQ